MACSRDFAGPVVENIVKMNLRVVSLSYLLLIVCAGDAEGKLCSRCRNARYGPQISVICGVAAREL